LSTMPMHGSHDWRMVALSVLIAVAAAYATLDLAGRVTAARRRARVYWVVGGATSMGTGIWAMHYVGMLAYSLPMKVYYDLPTVLASLLAAIVASAIALYTVSRDRLQNWQTAIGSLCMGSGIASMHYIGMAAMRLPARAEYNLTIVIVSVALAIVISFVALVLTFRVREEIRVSGRKIASALVMGSAIPVMHYTGMWAVTFAATNDVVDLSHAVNISFLGATAVSSVTGVVLFLAIGTSMMDRLVAAQRAVVEVAQQHETHFRTLAEAIPQIVWTARPDGYADYFNKRWYDYTATKQQQSVGNGWEVVVHPEDLSATLAAWGAAVESGTTYEVQYRFMRASDQTYRWFLGRAQPVRDSQGTIVKWFGTCTDIDDQKRSQESLEEEVRQRTAALLDANQQLTEEMQGREQAQHEMNLQTETLVRELTERSRKDTLLAKMGELLQSGTNVTEAFAIVTGFAPRIFPGWGGAIILLNASKSLLEVAGSWEHCKLISSFFEPHGCWALRTGHRYQVEAGDRSAPCAHATAVTGAYVCVPIQAHGEALGIIHLQLPEGAPAMSESELALIGTFAEQIALSIANIRLREALRNQSIRDPLTGLFNRRYLEETLEREMHRVQRSKQPLGVLMVDLDHFKRFNDTFGHDAGDAVLQEAGVLFASRVRAEDIACRYGGEEFVLILPNADLAMTTKRGELLCAEARKLEVLHNGAALGQVTISVGAACFPDTANNAQALLSAADGALYEAKDSGRDRVVTAKCRNRETQTSESAAAGVAG
jgi:diguanylate cyclase (GGDEF)-like protein/PAS domain S-box-containing protein